MKELTMHQSHTRYSLSLSLYLKYEIILHIKPISEQCKSNAFYACWFNVLSLTSSAIVSIKYVFTNRYFSALWSGRGFQLKHGVEGATGDFLLFLHSDTHLPSNFDVAAESCLKRPGNVAGSFAWSVDTDRFGFFCLSLNCLYIAHLHGM